jgi:hypothetical protein
MSKREVLLDRNSLIEHLKGCGHEEDMLFGMSDKGLFELYSNAMYENDLENYHASDANTDEYTIGLGDDIELGEATQTTTRTVSQDPEAALNDVLNTDKSKFSGTAKFRVTGGGGSTTTDVKVSNSNFDDAQTALGQVYIDPDKQTVTGDGSVTTKLDVESRKFDKKTLEEKFAKAKAKVEEKEISEEDNTDEGKETRGWRRLKRRGGKHYVSTVGGDGGLGINKPKPRTDESLEADKKLVMEMVGKHLRPVATKGKIMEYILNKSK